MTESKSVVLPFGLLDLMVLIVACGPALVILCDCFEIYRLGSFPTVQRTVSAALVVANAILDGAS